MERARNDLEEHRLICRSPLRRDRLDQGRTKGPHLRHETRSR
jgi:hypothetical protein